MQHPKCVIDKWWWFDRIGYKPHPGQMAAHEAMDRDDVLDALVVTGWGWG